MQEEGERRKSAIPMQTSDQPISLWERLFWLAAQCLGTTSVVKEDGKTVGHIVQFRGHITFVPAEETTEEDATGKGGNHKP